MVGIADPSIAFAFDLECGAMLLEFEYGREMAKFEMIALNKVSQAFGPQTQTGPLNGTRVGEITSANFRDQGF